MMIRTFAAAAGIALSIGLAGCSQASAPVSNRPAPAPVVAPVAAPKQEAPATSKQAPATSEKSSQTSTSKPSTNTSSTSKSGTTTSKDTTSGSYQRDGVITGPGAVDPDAYHGGKSSGEIQMEHACQQGYAPAGSC